MSKLQVLSSLDRDRGGTLLNQEEGSRGGVRTSLIPNVDATVTSGRASGLQDPEDCSALWGPWGSVLPLAGVFVHTEIREYGHSGTVLFQGPRAHVGRETPQDWSLSDPRFSRSWEMWGRIPNRPRLWERLAQFRPGPTVNTAGDAAFQLHESALCNVSLRRSRNRRWAAKGPKHEARLGDGGRGV